MQQQDYKRVASAPKQDSSHASRAVRSLSEGEEEIEVELPTIRSGDARNKSQRDKSHPRSPGEYPAPHATLLDNPPPPGGKEHKQQHQQHPGAVMGRGKQYLRLDHSDSRHEQFLDQEAQAIAEAEEELQFELEAGDQIGEHFGGTDGVPGGAPGAIPCAFISGRPLVYLCAACSSLCSVLLGYDVGVMSGAKEYIQPDLELSDSQTAVIVGSLNLVAALGALMAGKAADALGRRVTIALACTVFIVGAAMMAGSGSFGALLTGRVVTGVGVGAAMMVAPIYIAELAPPDVRGALVSLTDISINLGILLGYGGAILFDSVLTGESAKWRAMVGAGAIPPALVLMCLVCMPESPRWLIAKGNPRAGYSVLLRILADAKAARTSAKGNPRAGHSVLLRILADAKAARTSLHEMTESISHHAREARWKDVLCPSDRAIAAAVSIGLGLGFWQQASGSEAAVYYSPEVLKHSGWDGRDLLLGNMAVGTFKLAGEVVAFFLLDRVGRRPLLLVSSITSTLCLMAIALAFHLQWGGGAVLFLLSSFMLCFSLGLGPVTFVVASEIFPLAVRGKAMSLVVFINRAMSGIIALSYTALATALAPSGSFLMFAALSGISVLFYYWKVPETNGKTLEQITAELDVAAAAMAVTAAVNRNGDVPMFQQRAGDIIL